MRLSPGSDLFKVLDTGKIQSMADLERDIERVDKSMVREAMSRHVYDRDIACAGVGKTCHILAHSV